MNLLLSIGQSAFDWTWETSVRAAFLILLVLAAHTLFGKWLTARGRYFLSLLILIRLLLPFAPASPLSLENVIPRTARLTRPSAWASPATDAGAEKLPGTQAGILPPLLPSPRPSISSAGVFCLAWLSGCCGLMALAVWRFRKWNRLTKEADIISNPRLLALLDSARDAMGVHQPVKALAISQAAVPAVFGLWNPCLLLPRNILERLTDDELRFIFLHEMAHVRRRDALLNVLWMAAQFLHWFNPLVWLALHRLRADRELVCDEMVLRIIRPEERAHYGRLLLKLMDEFPTAERLLPGAMAVVGDQKEIKRRIIMIKKHGLNRVAGGVLAIIAITAASCATFTRAEVPVLAQPQPANGATLIGTWVLESGTPASQPSGEGNRLRLMTDTQWCITQADPKTGVVIFHHGGSYSLKGNEYVETLKYANSSTRKSIGHINKYTVKVEGDTLTMNGINTPFHEIWKRAK